MMKIFGIDDVPAFMEHIRSCNGKITIEGKAGEKRDLKALANDLQGFEMLFMGAKLDELVLYVDDVEDRSKLLRYMAEMAVA